MAWEVFSFIGTAAFAISGALVAMEEKYDILGYIYSELLRLSVEELYGMFYSEYRHP